MRFNLVRYVRFGHEVTAVGPSKSGGWEVTFTSNSTAGDASAEKAQKTTDVFDKCIIASGIFVTPYFPPPEKVRGITAAVENGWATHSGAYRDPEQFSGKSVLVVGCAFSGAEIASGEGYQVVLLMYSIPTAIRHYVRWKRGTAYYLPGVVFEFLLFVKQRKASWTSMHRRHIIADAAATTSRTIYKYVQVVP